MEYKITDLKEDIKENITTMLSKEYSVGGMGSDKFGYMHPLVDELKGKLLGIIDKHFEKIER